MKREDLKALNLEDAAIDAIMALHGKSTEALKSNLTTAQSETDTLRNQLKEANTQIEGFKGMKKPEEVDAAVNEWKTKFEQAEKEYSAKLVSMDFDKDFGVALTGAKVKYSNEVKSRLDLESLKDANGKFIAERFNEQITKIKSEAADLFESNEPAPKIVTGGNNPKQTVPDTLEAAMFKGAGIKPPEG